MKVSKNKLRRVQGVSFPRCGHHLLANCLIAYFSETPYVQQTKGESIIPELLGAWNFTYCEFYNHCNQVPCPCPSTTFQKNHDYPYHFPVSFWEPPSPNKPKPGAPAAGSSLDEIRKRPDTYFLIQYRKALPAVVSYYKMRTLHGNFEDLTASGTIRKPDTLETWKEMAVVFKKEWNLFMDRWVNNPLPNSLLLPYEDLLEKPKSSLENVIRFFDPLGEINTDFLNEIIRVQDIKLKNEITGFKYYDPKFFSFLETI